jgi:hypothetical protein
VTTRRPSGDRRRVRVKCPTCGRTFRWNSLARHRRNKHPQTEISALEAPNSEVRVRSDVTYSPLRCGECHGVIPTGTPRLKIVSDPGNRRKRWTHLVCPPSPTGGSAPSTPQNTEGPLALSLVASGVDPTPKSPPREGAPPASQATAGSPIVPSQRLLELGVVGTRAGGKTIVLELAEPNAEDVLSRLIGDDIVRCQTCAVFGKTVAVPKSYLPQHDLTEHADLWHRGRALAELAAIEERGGRKKIAKPSDTGRT